MCQPVTAATAPGGHQAVDLLGDPPGAGAPVDDHEPDLAPEHAALAVDLFGGQSRTGLTGRAEDPGRSLERDHQGDVEVVVTHRIRSQPRIVSTPMYPRPGPGLPQWKPPDVTRIWPIC
jgi:hypothetical protein